jgi:hypothetical protein
LVRQIQPSVIDCQVEFVKIFTSVQRQS